MTREWIPLTLSDPVLFQASINFAAVHHDFLLRQQDQSSNLTRKTRTIDMVNSSLSRPDTAVADACLGAVCLLAAIEVRDETDNPTRWLSNTDTS